MCFYMIVLMPFGAWKGHRAVIFLPWSIFFLKIFWSHYKGWKPPSFKLGDNHRLHYFLASIPSRHISHHHNWSIVNCWYFTYKYDWPTIGDWLWTWRDFHTYFEPTWHFITSPFSLILFLCTFSYSMMCFLIILSMTLIKLCSMRNLVRIFVFKW
jgi:hypothetical protein